MSSLEKLERRSVDSAGHDTPPTLAASPDSATADTQKSRKLSERELLEEFKTRMTDLRTGSFAGLWEEPALIIEYEARLCAGVSDDEKRQKKLRKLQQIYVDEFDLPPTTAQRYKRVYRFFAPLVASGGPGTPTLETLAEIQMSKLDLLVSLHVSAPTSWHFTDDGRIELDHSVWTGSNKDARYVSVDTLRAISKALNAAPEQQVPQQQVSTPPDNVVIETPTGYTTLPRTTANPPQTTEPVMSNYVDPAPAPYHPHTTAPSVNNYVDPAPAPYLSVSIGEEQPKGLASDSTAPAMASISVWDEYQVQTTAQDGKIRYPDPASDTGYSERVFHAVNGSVEAVYDGTSNMPELRIRPIASEREAHAILWRPDAGDGTTPERSIIIYDPTVGHYLTARLALKN